MKTRTFIHRTSQSIFAIVCLVFMATSVGRAQSNRTSTAVKEFDEDSTKKTSTVTARSINPLAYRIILRAVDISRFPEVSVILDARDKEDSFFPSLRKSDLIIIHDGVPRPITAMESISAMNSLPIDIVFVIDQTGSMRKVVNEVKSNVEDFTSKLAKNGIDYRLGLITFSDKVERRRELTNDVKKFIDWVDGVSVAGGGDANENALEGLREATTLKYRNAAQRIFILITDAMFHQAGDKGDGTTTFTTKSMIDFLGKNAVRLYAVTPPNVPQFDTLVGRTHGQRFDIIQDFSSILENFSTSLTNLYAVKYRMTETVPPEAASIEILNQDNELLVKERVELLGVDKKFIVDHILFDFDRATLRTESYPELQHILGMLRAYQTMEVEIQGHTDDVGSDEYNVALSEARSLAVKRYLVSNGINTNRIRTKGLGKAFPIAANDNEQGRQRNRRTEIVIIKK